MNFFPDNDQRVVFMGPTTCGKSTLARLLLAYHNRVVIVDCKGSTGSSRGWKADEDTEYVITNPKALDINLFNDYDHIVYRPPQSDLLPENSRNLDYVPQWCMEQGDILLYYDDLVFIANDNNFARRAPNYFLAVTTGAGLGVVVWSSVQRPHRIPIVALSESDRRICFYLRHSSDRKTAEELMGENVPWEELKETPHSFYIADDLEEQGPVILEFNSPTETREEQIA